MQRVYEKISIENIVKYSQYDSWFIHEISEIIDFENILLKNFNEEILLKAKSIGFSDTRISKISKVNIRK